MLNYSSRIWSGDSIPVLFESDRSSYSREAPSFPHRLDQIGQLEAKSPVFTLMRRAFNGVQQHMYRIVGRRHQGADLGGQGSVLVLIPDVEVLDGCECVNVFPDNPSSLNCTSFVANHIGLREADRAGDRIAVYASWQSFPTTGLPALLPARRRR